MKKQSKIENIICKKKQNILNSVTLTGIDIKFGVRLEGERDGGSESMEMDEQIFQGNF